MTSPADDLLVTVAQKAAAGRAALLVIDVQNDFVADGGYFDRVGADVTAIRRVVPPLSRLVEAARAAGLLVVFVQAIYDPEHLSAPMRERNRRRNIDIPRCRTGTWGADFNGPRPAPGDAVIIKHRYSAFTNPALDRLLRQHAIESVLLTGVATETCVESTGRDLYFADYYVTMIADCCASARASDHAAALARFERDYGSVVNADAVMATWRNAQPAARPGAGASAHG